MFFALNPAVMWQYETRGMTCADSFQACYWLTVNRLGLSCKKSEAGPIPTKD